jgi:aminopeptidase N
VQDFARGIPVFRVPVDVAIVNAAGRSTRRVWIREREETFELPSETRPLLVRFDPDNVLLKELTFPKQREELLYQLGHDDVIGRMSAAGELATLKGDPVAAGALSRSAQGDPFWGVRRSAIAALARVAGVQGLAAMKTAATDDVHPSVRGAALAAMGDLKDRGLLEFFKGRFASDGSDAVRAESLRAIGKLGDPSTGPFLEQCAAVPSYRNMIATAARQAITAARSRPPG